MDRLIEFHIRADLKDAVPAPFPASHAIPEWLRNMPMESTEPGFSTVKRCPPFLDAMSCGYIIPVPTDITIGVRENDIDIEVVGFQSPLVETHNAYQFPGAPFPPMPALKFVSPWIIKTPPGYSTLFMAPLNRFELPVLPLSGLVDTDVLYQEVSFPTLCLIQRGSRVTLKKGTPLVQVIPVLREAWLSQMTERDEQAYAAWRSVAQGRPHAYKEDLWVKKTFT